MVYRDRNGRRIRESTNTEDWQEAQRKLRDRLQARDDRILDIVRRGEQLQFADWVDFFLENYRSEEHTSELQSLRHLVCRLLLEKKKKNTHTHTSTSRRQLRDSHLCVCCSW